MNTAVKAAMTAGRKTKQRGTAAEMKEGAEDTATRRTAELEDTAAGDAFPFQGCWRKNLMQ